MHSLAFAIGYQLWRRHWRGMLIALAAMAVMSILYPLLFAWSRDERTLLASYLPLLLVIGYFFNIMLCADRVGDLAIGYPRRMYVLPVPSWQLALWPMLYAAVVMTIVWLVIAGGIYRPSGLHPPLLVPALGLAATIVWIQALSWTPFGNPWVRVIVTSFLFTAMLMGPTFLLAFGWISRSGVAVMLIGYLALAYLIAAAGLARDRRGDTWTVRLDQLADRRTNRAARQLARSRPFRSTAEAQLAYEWRLHGWFLPVMTFGYLMLVDGMLLLVGKAPRLNFLTIFVSFNLLMPLIMAGSLGAGAALFRPFWVQKRTAATFALTRPMTSGELVRAKFRAAWRSVLLTWAGTVVMTLIGIVVWGRYGAIGELARSCARALSSWRGALSIVLGAALLPIATWRQYTDLLVIGLTGRRWVINGATTLGAAVLLGLITLGLGAVRSPELATVLVAIEPAIVGVGALAKGLIASWAFVAASRRGLIERAKISRLLLAWVILAASTIGFVSSVLPADGWLSVSRWVWLVAAVAYLPLGRFALAPLALEWGRHR